MNWKPRQKLLTLVLSLIFLLSCSSLVQGEVLIEQIVLILWHGLEIEQIPKFEIEEITTWGLFNTRGGGGEPITSSYLSLGAGARAVGWSNAANFSQSEADFLLYQFHTGKTPSDLVQPQIAQINQAQQVNYHLEIGALGKVFREANLPIRVLGNSDGENQVSWAALVAMDEFGRVFRGNLGSADLVEDPAYPFGVKTDYGKLRQDIVLAQEPLVVVDLGDLYRFDRYQNRLLPRERDRIQEKVFAEAHTFLESLVALQKPKTVFIVVSPHPSQRRSVKGIHLTPIFALGLQPGLFTSATTRWPGLITNMDLAPTIINWLQLEHQQAFIGRPATITEGVDPQTTSFQLGLKIMGVASRRALVLQIVILSQILLYLSVLVVLIVPREPVQKLFRPGQTLLLLFLLLPLILLLQSKVGWLILGISALILVFLIKSFSPLVQMGFITLITTLIIAFDVFRGSWLMRFSHLGYDAIGGARFYGIGNEFMGIFVGSTVLTWAIFCENFPLWNKYRSIIGVGVFTSALAIIGAPSLGTNVGGAITGVFAFGTVWLSVKYKKINWLQIFASLIAGLFAVLALLILIDRSNPTNLQSHIGQTAQLFQRDGFDALWLIIIRKLGMNLKLLRYSMWSKALIVALIVLGVSFIWPSRFIDGLKATYPLVVKGIGGLFVGSIAAFIFNDSGVVAAATCLYFAVTTLLILALELKHNFDAPKPHVKDNGDSH